MSDNNMIKIYWVPCRYDTREHLLIKQGLSNNPRVELVATAKESDFVFQFYYVGRHKDFYKETFPAKKTVVIDYHDNPGFRNLIDCCAYFKRSWVRSVREKNFTERKHIWHPENFHPLSLAIMDEFIIDGDIKRDVALSCTLRIKERRPNIDRLRVLKLLESMKIKSKKVIGQLNKGNMLRFNALDMREYFKLLRRSKIVVTCNPTRWEGDHRTWEAFANGALVFVDRMLTPLRHPLIDGKHCIFYDLSNKGFEKLREKIFFFLANPLLADEIAEEGHKFAMRYHRSSNRIDEILDVIT